ncbi:hypothetical protein BJY04DRAFT_218824 [Aspergillus karnatakaensis]|uniref:uncharacterized protein n=1 Tax=Aspergillus karnatakaensis TaxID=1810916 RepID=UPI003CCD033E
MARDGLESPESQPSPAYKDDSLDTRIPRGVGLRQPANFSAVKGPRLGPEARSSIPVAVRSRSAEQLGTVLQGKQSDTPPIEIRQIDRPPGPRPRPFAEPNLHVVSKQTPTSERIVEPDTISTSSSSIGDWDLDEENELKRRPTGFTGEYRTRVLASPGQQIAGPVLRVASSAENLIMGEAPQEASIAASMPKSSPPFSRFLGKLSLGTTKDIKSLKVNTPGSKSSSQESTPITRNFCRPQVSMDSIPKRDISGKEMSISRKPVNRPSLSSLFSPSSKSLHLEDEPLVPRIPDQYFASQENTALVSGKANEPETPAKTVPGPKGTVHTPESSTIPTPETVIKCTMTPQHPPRTSSLQVLSDHPSEHQSEQEAAAESGTHLVDAGNMRRNVTFNAIVPLSPVSEQFIESPERARLPESRSNMLLGGIRSIFKARGGVDRERIRKEDISSPMAVDENLFLLDGQDPVEKDLDHTDSEKSGKPKPKLKHSRLPSAVSWTKGSRNPKTATVSPKTPTPSFPRLLAPPKRLPDANIPSFARSTKSTRTKAGVKGQPNPDVRTRKLHVRTASTGSPQRLSQGSKRSPDKTLMLSSQEKVDESPISAADITTISPSKSSDSVPKNLDTFRDCLEAACKKAGEAKTLVERIRFFRVSFVLSANINIGCFGAKDNPQLALSLQQQLGDYQFIEQIALDAESLAKSKNLERKTAEESLDALLSKVQAQLEED